MTAGSIINYADRTRPNLVSYETKLNWLYTIEKKIADHMNRFSNHKITHEFPEESTPLLLGKEYKDMYAYYIVCMTDLANQDIAMYNNSCAYFNELFDSWRKKWRRENTPATHMGGDI